MLAIAALIGARLSLNVLALAVNLAASPGSSLPSWSAIPDATAGTLAMSYQMCGLTSGPEICITSAALSTTRLGVGDGANSLSMKSSYPTPFSITNCALLNAAPVLASASNSCGSAFGSDMIDVTFTCPPPTCLAMSPQKLVLG